MYFGSSQKMNQSDFTGKTACECSNSADDGIYLFTTATCPNCKIAIALLDKAGVKYEKLLANEHAEWVNQLGIKQAPTLVVIKNGETAKYIGVSDIKKFIGN